MRNLDVVQYAGSVVPGRAPAKAVFAIPCFDLRKCLTQFTSSQSPLADSPNGEPSEEIDNCLDSLNFGSVYLDEHMFAMIDSA